LADGELWADPEEDDDDVGEAEEEEEGDFVTRAHFNQDSLAASVAKETWLQ
jgi:hypothetical protein